MGKKLPYTPSSRIRSAIRQLWLRSRERQAALVASGRKCVHCGVKASAAKGKEVKLVVHHKHGVGNWDKVTKVIREELLCNPENLEACCIECHKKIHGGQDAH